MTDMVAAAAAAAAARPPPAIDTGEGPSKRSGASATQAAATATANLRGWFAGDWATDDKIDLLAQTYTVYSSLQRIAAESRRASKPGLVPPAQTLQYYHRISGLYREAIRRYMEAVAARRSGGEEDEEEEEEEEERELELSQSIHTTLHLAETLYLPVDGRGAGVVGEEVLHWLNSFDFAPRTEDGQAIAQAAVPYEHPSYWDYILRCVLRGFHTTAASLLGSLASSHPSHALRGVASRVAKLLASLPRSTSFTLEHDFLAAHRRWLGQVRALLAGLEGDMDDMERELGQSRRPDDEEDGDGDDVEDERLELEAQFRCLVELMAGVRDRVFEACENWTEALGAWGVLVQPALKRDDVPQTMAAILGRFSVDEARRPGDAVQAALARGDVSQACTAAATRVDPWLAAHLADLVAKAGVLDAGAAHERNQLVAVYAETLLDDQGLWRMAIDYLATCDGDGDGDRASTRRRMAAILVSIDLVGPHAVAARPRARPRPIDELEAEQRRAEEMMDDEAELRRESEEAQQRRSASDEVARIEEVLLACREHGMEREARRVCSRVARQLLARRRYGEAVAFCRRADDARGIRRIVARILDVYICDGADAFCALVDAMPPSLLAPGGAGLDGDTHTDTAADDDADAQLGFALSTRLAFLAQYRDFHRLYAAQRSAEAGALLVEMLSSDSCPQPFYAVLLVDAIPLLMRGSDGLDDGLDDGLEGEGEEGEQQGFTNDETMELLRILDVVMAASSRHERLARHYLGPLQRLLVGPSPNATAAGQAKTQGQGQSQGQAGQKGLVEEAEAEAEAKEDEDEDEEGEEEEDGKGDVIDVQASTRRLDILRLALAKRLADIL